MLWGIHATNEITTRPASRFEHTSRPSPWETQLRVCRHALFSATRFLATPCHPDERQLNLYPKIGMPLPAQHLKRRLVTVNYWLTDADPKLVVSSLLGSIEFS